MRITFLLPFLNISGGVSAVFKLANRLQDAGHQVTVVYPLIPLCAGRQGYGWRQIINRIGGTVLNIVRGNRVGWFPLETPLLRVPTLSERFIPEADAVVATWWETAYYAAAYGQDKGKKFYFVQHFETWGGPEDKVLGTFSLGLRCIVNSVWLKNKIESVMGTKVHDLILHAPEWREFYFEQGSRSENGPLRVLMAFRRQDWKGVDDGIAAFEEVFHSHPSLKLVLFGEHPAGRRLPPYAEFHLSPSNAELRKLYNSCHIFLFPSWHEGFGMPPMEAMACKCAVVTTNVGGVPDYAIAGKTALVCEPRDVKAMARHLQILVDDPLLRRQIAEDGYESMKQFTWEDIARKFEEALRR